MLDDVLISRRAIQRDELFNGILLVFVSTPSARHTTYRQIAVDVTFRQLPKQSLANTCVISGICGRPLMHNEDEISTRATGELTKAIVIYALTADLLKQRLGYLLQDIL